MNKISIEKQNRELRKALRMLARECPALVKLCYWAGTASVAMEELGHRQSFDLDFHTRKALQDVRPLLAQIYAAFGDRFEILQAPDEFGSGFRGLLTLSGGKRITVEVLANYEDVKDDELVSSRTVASLKRVSLQRYLADKVQCIAERVEARDLVDIAAVLRCRPEMQALAKRILAEQDALILAERLLAWTDAEIERDLEAYPDADPDDAKETRQILLAWLKSNS